MATFTINTDNCSIGDFGYYSISNWGSIPGYTINMSSEFTSVETDRINSPSVAQYIELSSTQIKFTTLAYAEPATIDSSGNIIPGSIHSTVPNLMAYNTFTYSNLGDSWQTTTDGKYYIVNQNDAVALGLYAIADDICYPAIFFMDTDTGVPQNIITGSISAHGLYNVARQESSTLYERSSVLPVLCGYYSTVLSQYVCFSPYTMLNVAGTVNLNSSNSMSQGVIPTNYGFGNITATVSSDYNRLQLPPSRNGAYLQNATPAIRQIFGSEKTSEPVEPDPDNSNPYHNSKSDDPDIPSENVGNHKTGTGDYSSDTVTIPDVPDIDITDSGFCNIYNPTKAQIKNLATYMLSSNVLESLAKLYSDPIDFIIAIMIMPIKPTTGSDKRIYIGNKDSGLDWPEVTSEYMTVDCGSLSLNFPTGSYLDFEPYTKLSIYLPYVGIQNIDIDTFCMESKSGSISGSITVTYRIDVLTGGFIVYLTREDGTVMYTYGGNMAVQVPITGAKYDNMYQSLISLGVSAVGLGATIATGGGTGIIGSMLDQVAGSTANAVTSQKPQYQHSGSLQSMSGMLGLPYPVLIYEYPNPQMPDEQYKYTGYPSGTITKLSNLKGFTTVQAVNLTVEGATQAEIDEIKTSLERGVIL